MNLTCDTVRDLVSIYKDKLASESSVNAIEEHLKQCPDCRKYYKQYDSICKLTTSKYNISTEDSYLKKYTDLSVKLRTRRILSVIGLTVFMCGALATILINIFKLSKNNK